MGENKERKICFKIILSKSIQVRSYFKVFRVRNFLRKSEFNLDARFNIYKFF
jgi:hypothetical protein